MYAYVKNVPVQVKYRSYRTIQQLFTSNNVHIHNDDDNGAYHMNKTLIENIFNQNKKLIAINDRKIIAN